MRKTLKTLVVTSALVAGIAVAPALYAQSTEATPGTQAPVMGQGDMTGQGGMGQGKMMGQGGMGQGNMMGMMAQMAKMMEAHGKDMQSMMKEHGVAPSATE